MTIIGKIKKPSKNGLYDAMLEKIVSDIVPTVTEKKKDHYILFCFGETNTGKSSLMLHAYELFDEEGCNAKYIGFDQETFADALKDCRTKENRRFVCADEFNVSKRRSTSKWNNSLIDLYFNIRAENIFHWLNNPSLDIIDKSFIQEVIKGFIYIKSKKDGKRPYYFFRKKELLEVYEKEGNLNRKTIRKHLDKAYYMGWFKAYKGKLWDEYLDKKMDRSGEKIEEFWQQFGSSDLHTQAEVGRRLGVSSNTVRRYAKELLKKGEFEEGVHFKTMPNGRFFTSDAVETLRTYAYDRGKTISISD